MPPKAPKQPKPEMAPQSLESAPEAPKADPKTAETVKVPALEAATLPPPADDEEPGLTQEEIEAPVNMPLLSKAKNISRLSCGTIREDY